MRCVRLYIEVRQGAWRIDRSEHVKKAKRKSTRTKGKPKLFLIVDHRPTVRQLPKADRKTFLKHVAGIEAKIAKVNALEGQGKPAKAVERNVDVLIRAMNKFLASAFKAAAKNAPKKAPKKSKKTSKKAPKKAPKKAKKASKPMKKAKAKAPKPMKKAKAKAPKAKAPKAPKKAKAPKKKSLVERLMPSKKESEL